MARMKFLCDAERCIECNGCVTACKQENEVPWGVNRRRVVTINDGVLYQARMPVPSTVVTGRYTAETFAISRGRVIASAVAEVEVGQDQAGDEHRQGEQPDHAGHQHRPGCHHRANDALVHGRS